MWLEEPYIWEKGKWTVVIDRASAKWLSGEIVEETKDPAGRYTHIPFTLRKTDANIVLAEDYPVPKYVWDAAYKLVSRVGADVWGWTGGLGAHAPDFDPSQERMFDEVVLMAVNEGRFYPRNPKKAGEWALREYIRLKMEEMREDAKIIRAAVVREVQRQWMQR